MTREREASAIIAHYLKALTQASGRRWTEHNDRDMQRLAELLADEQADCIQPFYQAAPKLPAESTAPTAAPSAAPPQLDSRVTVVLDQAAGREQAKADDLDDPIYQRWRQQRQRDERTITQRMIERERPDR